jgi:hypothetical protein
LDEVSVKALFKEVVSDEILQKYLPDLKEGAKLPPRDYFFTVVNTLRPNYISDLMQ